MEFGPNNGFSVFLPDLPNRK